MIETISAANFLRSIFGNEWPRAWVTSFRDFPTGPGDWTGGTVWGRQDMELDGNANLFFCIALMKPGSTQRSVGNVEGHRVIVADDIGTKVPREKWETLLALGFPAPMWRIETSPGNQTWLWVLDRVVPAGTEAEKDVLKLRALIAAHGLSDRVVTMDPARYTRLPGGWNSKQKYRQEGGGWPRVKLIEHLEGATVTLDRMGAVLAGGDWRDAELPEEVQTNAKSLGAAHSGALVRRADMNDPEPIIRLAQEVGLNPVQIRRGVVQAECPNAAQHTDGRGDGFAFLGNGVMQCMHDHCQHLATPDFRRMICEAFDAQVDARKAVGLPVVADSAGEFLAREDFRRHGALVAAGDGGQTMAVPSVEDEAEQVAERMETARVQVQQNYEAALKALVERLVYVQSADAFFDVVGRETIPQGQIERAEIVRAVIPVGGTGLKHARTIIMNHPALRSVSTFAYRPGETNAIVQVESDTGNVVAAVNKWTPSRVGRRKERPDAWLRMFEYQIPDQDARDEFLKWLAWALQNPGKRTARIPLLIGEQGTGKDMLLAPIVAIMGAHNAEVVDEEKMESSFNDWQRARFILFSELMLGGGKLYNKLKAWTGSHNTFLRINAKFEREWKMIPVSVFFAISNHLDAIKGVETNDRRFMAYVSPAKPKEPSWYEAMGAALVEPAELERIHDYLLSMNLTGYNPNAPAPQFGDMKQSVIAESLPAPARWAYDECVKGRFKDRVLLSMQEVYEAAQVSGDRNVKNYANQRNIRDGMKLAGCEPIGRMRDGADRIRVWHGVATKDMPDMRSALEGLTAKALVDRYKAEAEKASLSSLGV